MAEPARTPPPREGIVDLDERRRLAAEAEAREREASLRADPTVGPVGEPPRPIASDRPVRTNEDALAQARGDLDPRDRTNQTQLHRDPVTPPATPPTYDDDVRYAEREGSPGYGESRDPDQLQDEIELLQNRMQQRLEGITSAFEPQNLIAAATGTKNPDIFTTVDTVVDAARRNPVPAALIAAGMAGLFLNGRYGRRPVRGAEPYEALPPGAEGVDTEGRRYAASGIAEPSTADKAEEQVRALQDATASRLEAASIATRETYEDVRNRVSSGTSYVADTGREAWDWVKENPTAIGLAALAAGALAAGYYTASPPKRRPIPRDRALTVRDDYADPYATYRDRRDYPSAPRRDAASPTMPVSSAAPAPMPPSMGVGVEPVRTGTIGGSGQIETPGAARDTVPATPRGGVQPVGGIATGTSRDRTTDGPTTSGAATAGAAAAGAALSGSALLGDVGSRSSTTTGPSAGTTPPSGTSAGEAARDPSRVPSGAGFGSTAASRGEVASKPSDGHAPKATETQRSGSATSDAPAMTGSTATGTSGGSTAARTETPPSSGTPKGEGERRTDDTSNSTVELTDVYPRS